MALKVGDYTRMQKQLRDKQIGVGEWTRFQKTWNAQFGAKSQPTALKSRTRPRTKRITSRISLRK